MNLPIQSFIPDDTRTKIKRLLIPLAFIALITVLGMLFFEQKSMIFFHHLTFINAHVITVIMVEDARTSGGAFHNITIRKPEPQSFK